jgi:hypothetical protein
VLYYIAAVMSIGSVIDDCSVVCCVLMMIPSWYGDGDDDCTDDIHCCWPFTVDSYSGIRFDTLHLLFMLPYVIGDIIIVDIPLIVIDIRVILVDDLTISLLLIIRWYLLFLLLLFGSIIVVFISFHWWCVIVLLNCVPRWLLLLLLYWFYVLLLTCCWWADVPCCWCQLFILLTLLLLMMILLLFIVVDILLLIILCPSIYWLLWYRDIIVLMILCILLLWYYSDLTIYSHLLFLHCHLLLFFGIYICCYRCVTFVHCCYCCPIDIVDRWLLPWYCSSLLLFAIRYLLFLWWYLMLFLILLFRYSNYSLLCWYIIHWYSLMIPLLFLFLLLLFDVGICWCWCLMLLLLFSCYSMIICWSIIPIYSVVWWWCCWLLILFVDIWWWYSVLVDIVVRWWWCCCYSFCYSLFVVVYSMKCYSDDRWLLLIGGWYWCWPHLWCCWPFICCCSVFIHWWYSMLYLFIVMIFHWCYWLFDIYSAFVRCSVFILIHCVWWCCCCWYSWYSWPFHLFVELLTMMMVLTVVVWWYSHYCLMPVTGVIKAVITFGRLTVTRALTLRYDVVDWCYLFVCWCWYCCWRTLLTLTLRCW